MEEEKKPMSLEIKFKIKEISDLYPSFKSVGINQRYFPYKDLVKELENQSEYDFLEIGKSTLQQSIFKTELSKGAKKVLIWSQMHGNESTGTRAMFDVMRFLTTDNPIAVSIKEQLGIVFIPMLNPDGANAYTRRTAVGIDPNRDLVAKQSVEIKTLLKELKSSDYEVLFNLHDQRSIFNVGETNQPATLSFLAPSVNVEREVTSGRKQTMGIISAINKEMQILMPGRVGRYTDEFYLTATGDNFQKEGYCSVLFEAGHSPGDRNRNETRKQNSLAIISGLYYLASHSDYAKNHTAYFDIPQNGQMFTDVIIRNCKVEAMESQRIDLALQARDTLVKGSLLVKYHIVDIGDLKVKFGHKEYDAKERVYKSKHSPFPILNQEADFELGKDWLFVNGELKIK